MSLQSHAELGSLPAITNKYFSVGQSPGASLNNAFLLLGSARASISGGWCFLSLVLNKLRIL